METVETGKPRRLTRKGVPKSRSGCRPCKRAHKKCDETEPVCLRCQKSGSTCDLEYTSSRLLRPSCRRPHVRPLLPLTTTTTNTASAYAVARSSSVAPAAPSRAPKQHPHQNHHQQQQPQSLPRPLLSTIAIGTTPLTPAQSLYYDRFRVRAQRIRSADGSPCDLWYRTMLREGLRDAAVRDCLVAIGALDRAHEGLLLLLAVSDNNMATSSSMVGVPLYKFGEIDRCRQRRRLRDGGGLQDGGVFSQRSSSSSSPAEWCSPLYSSFPSHGETDWHDDDDRQGSARRDALYHLGQAARCYSRALHSLRARLSLLVDHADGRQGRGRPHHQQQQQQQEELRRTLLIASLLFIVFETMQGNADAANGLFTSSMRLLRDHLVGRSAPAMRLGPTAAALDDKGVHMGKMFMIRAAACRRMCLPTTTTDTATTAGCSWTEEMVAFPFDGGAITAIPGVAAAPEEIGNAWDQFVAYAFSWVGVAQSTAEQFADLQMAVAASAHYRQQPATTSSDEATPMRQHHHHHQHLQRRLRQLRRSQTALIALCERWISYVDGPRATAATSSPHTTPRRRPPPTAPPPLAPATTSVIRLGARMLRLLALACLDATTAAWDAQAVECEAVLRDFSELMLLHVGRKGDKSQSWRSSSSSAATASSWSSSSSSPSPSPHSSPPRSSSSPAATAHDPSGSGPDLVAAWRAQHQQQQKPEESTAFAKAFLDEQLACVVYAVVAGCRARGVRGRLGKGIVWEMVGWQTGGSGRGKGVVVSNWSVLTALMRLVGACKQEERGRVVVRIEKGRGQQEKEEEEEKGEEDIGNWWEGQSVKGEEGEGFRVIDGGIPLSQRLRWISAEWDDEYTELTVVNRRLGTSKDETMKISLADFIDGTADIWDF